METQVDFLKGTKILLIGHYIPCPFAAYLLRGLGARVIKVEPPFGDLMRQLPPFLQGKSNCKMSAYFRMFNGGFESISVNLKEKLGREVLGQLIAKSDVVLDGNRPGYLEKLIEMPLSQLNEKIIHIPVTAHGLNGPLRDIAGHDNNILARNGMLSFTTPSAAISGVQVADISAGFTAAFMAVAGLLGCNNNQSKANINVIDVSMLHAASAMTQMYVAGMNASNESPKPGEELLNGSLPNYRRYETKDGRWIFFGPIEGKLFKNFVIRTNSEDLMEIFVKAQKDTKAQDLLQQKLELLFKSKSLKDWEETLLNCDCCFTAINNLDEAMNEPQMQALGLVTQIEDPKYGSLQLPGYPAGFTKASYQPEGIHAAAPELGEHSRSILQDLLEWDNELCDYAINTRVVTSTEEGKV